ncbi:hypothetical protein P154DRAFT_596258 [Amniculicola lignicola CBS 123094]|uniref:Uncharacterized protein n=1 Tax=Amniculicola lignicola CBS 123094 TaxID=1392246 RepID=A0A6A5WVJ0_9PLEO|nr:hypothetical protein P154DRAFT_596258 [Amniculicola lignicola CBS 123094]
MASSIISPEAFQKFLKEHRITPKYESATETQIPHPWLEVGQNDIQECLKQMSNIALVAMGSIPEQDVELKHLRTVAELLPCVQRSAPIKVALVGAQGAGKSLLINALFDTDGLSMTGADGAACTSSIICYKNYPSDRPEGERTFLAEIAFLDVRSQEEMIKQHAKSYYYYHQEDGIDDESEDEHGPKAKGPGQDEADRRLKDTAQDVFHTLFGSREAFLEAWSSHEYRDGEFVKICQLKCQEALHDLPITGDNTATYVGSNPKDLLKKIRGFMANVKGEVSLWPLVDAITIRFQSPLLDEGVMIMDLPGWGDTNLSRIRHTDSIKSSVDIELIVADTIRISSDDDVIGNARSAVLAHGAGNVKLIATKIDQLSNNQLSQCTGLRYDEIKLRMLQAEEGAARAEEDDDTSKSDLLAKYKLHLERILKQRKIEERAIDITQELGHKLNGRGAEDSVICFHISAAEYMTWISKDKIMFRDHPALHPELTGIPGVRRYLRSLPAQQNLKDMRTHIFSTVPSFIEKIKRVVSDEDRDAGFKDLADEFDTFRETTLEHLLFDCRKNFKRIAQDSSKAMNVDSAAYKQRIDSLITKSWLQHKAPTFNKLLKSRGTVLPGTSRAKGLEFGCDWNKALSDVLAPGFRKWSVSQTASVKELHVALGKALDSIYNEVHYVLSHSLAGVNTIERAKYKWKPFRFRLRARSETLVDDMLKHQEKLLHQATMDDERANSLMASVTDSLFDEVFTALPALKPNPNGKKPQFVTPKFKFQKDYLLKLFIYEKKHIVDRAMTAFLEMTEKNMEDVIEKHLAAIRQIMDCYSEVLRQLTPVAYVVNKDGIIIRDQLREVLPKLEELAGQLPAFLPATPKNEEDGEMGQSTDSVTTKPASTSLSYYLKKDAKRKRGAGKTKIKKEEGILNKRARMG